MDWSEEEGKQTTVHIVSRNRVTSWKKTVEIKGFDKSQLCADQFKASTSSRAFDCRTCRGGKGIGQFELCLAGMKFWTGSVKSFRWNTSASSWKWTCLKVNSLLSRGNGSEDRPWFWILQKNGSSIQLLGGPFEHNFGLEGGEGGGNFIKPIFKKFKYPGGCPRGCWSFGMIDTLPAVMTTYWRLFSLRTELRVRVPPSRPFTGTVAYYTPYAYGKRFLKPLVKKWSNMNSWNQSNISVTFCNGRWRNRINEKFEFPRCRSRQLLVIRNENLYTVNWWLMRAVFIWNIEHYNSVNSCIVVVTPILTRGCSMVYFTNWCWSSIFVKTW